MIPVQTFGPQESTVIRSMFDDIIRQIMLINLCNTESELFVHDFCWKRLLKHFERPPNFDKLIEVLQETPMPNYRKSNKISPTLSVF